MEVFKKDVPMVAPEFQIKNSSTIARTKRPGTVVCELAVATFDTAALDSSGAANTAVGAHGLGLYLPAKAIILSVWTDVVTTFTSAASTATIALSVQSANDIVSAVAINSGTSRWNAGIGGTIVGTQALDGNALTAIGSAAATGAAMIKLTAIREVTATVAVQALTAGKMNIYVEYFISD